MTGHGTHLSVLDVGTYISFLQRRTLTQSCNQYCRFFPFYAVSWMLLKGYGLSGVIDDVAT